MTEAMSDTSPLRLTGPDRDKPVPRHIIHALAEIIAQKFDPDKIVLFGSYAYGDPKPWSDVDLLVIMDVPKGEELKTALTIRKSLPPRSFGLDLVVRSQAEIDRRIGIDDWFLEEITTQGEVLYERDHRRVDIEGRE